MFRSKSFISVVLRFSVFLFWLSLSGFKVYGHLRFILGLGNSFFKTFSRTSPSLTGGFPPLEKMSRSANACIHSRIGPLVSLSPKRITCIIFISDFFISNSRFSRRRRTDFIIHSLDFFRLHVQLPLFGARRSHADK